MTTESAQLRCFRSDFLNLIILPTEACNFRCTYCYEKFEHKKMPERVVAGIKSLIDRCGGDLNELQISWFGGEPLLAYDVVSEISRHAAIVAKSRNFAFAADMTTNGYFLDRKQFENCLEHEIRSFQISFDGAERTHNSSRKLASGAGTFGKIWANIMEIRRVADRFRIVLRLNYTLENFLDIAEFGRRINDTLGSDPRFQVNFKRVVRLGGPNDESVQVLSRDMREDVEEFLWDSSGLRRPSDSDEDYICYASMGNSLVIRASGRLAKCTVALSDELNDIGSISENGDICIDETKFRRWIAPTIQKRWEWAACPWKSIAVEMSG